MNTRRKILYRVVAVVLAIAFTVAVGYLFTAVIGQRRAGSDSGIRKGDATPVPAPRTRTSVQTQNGHEVFLPKLVKISTFETSYETSGADRSVNVALAAERFCWLSVPAGGELSFNGVVGERTEARGFRPAKVILNGEYVVGMGGGVCQVSSTLYNAWIRAGLGVKEARAHTLPASYCAMSQDATVSEWIDMVLLNDRDTAVVVNGYTKNRHVCFDVYGQPTEFEYKVRTEVVGVLPPSPPEIVFGDTGGQAVRTVTEEKNGYCTRAILEIYRDGQLFGERVLRRDVYKPVRGKVMLPQGAADSQQPAV